MNTITIEIIGVSGKTGSRVQTRLQSKNYVKKVAATNVRKHQNGEVLAS